MSKNDRDVIALGEVVCCYRGKPAECYGVVVHQPREPQSERDPAHCYRVRISTASFERYVELGVFREDLERDPERAWRWTGSAGWRP